MDTIENGTALIHLFNLANNGNYDVPTPLKDIKAGFSVKREYPHNIRYKPLVNKNNEIDSFALIHVICVYDPNPNVTKDRIYLRISNYSKYLENHYDFNFEDESSPTEESVLLSRKTPKPISLENPDSYFYDRNLKAIVDEGNKIVNGIAILDELFNKHCQTISPWKGLFFRFKLKTGRFKFHFYNFLIGLVEMILENIWDRQITRDYKTYSDIISKENIKLLSVDSINIFGYKVSKKIAVLFSFLTIIFYTIFFFYGTNSEYLKTLFTNGLLIVCFVISMLFILDTIFPNYLFLPIINFLVRKKWKYSFKKYKI